MDTPDHVDDFDFVTNLYSEIEGEAVGQYVEIRVKKVAAEQVTISVNSWHGVSMGSVSLCLNNHDGASNEISVCLDNKDGADCVEYFYRGDDGWLND